MKVPFRMTIETDDCCWRSCALRISSGVEDPELLRIFSGVEDPVLLRISSGVEDPELLRISSGVEDPIIDYVNYVPSNRQRLLLIT